MEWVLLVSLVLLPFVFGSDPAPGLLRTRAESRNLDCERVSTETGSQRYPGVIDPESPRGAYVERSVVICKERVMRPGLRSARDEAFLLSLQEQATALATAAATLRPELLERTWLVETHFPSSQVAAKISFATKNALVVQGLAVSDRTPVLGADDVDVITRMAPQQAYRAACQRYTATGGLAGDDALLAVVQLDPRETILHAGICLDGGWEWLR